MKIKHHLILMAIVLAIFTGSAQAQQSIVAVHRAGVALYNQGDYVNALAKFKAVLKVKPNYIHSRVYFNKCNLALKQGGVQTNTVEAQLVKVIIPSLDFQEVPLGDALAYITQRSQELTGGKVTPNIIFNGTTEQRSAGTITMKLRQVPVTTLLKYIGAQTRCRIAYDKHAVLVTPFDNVQQTAATPKAPAPAPNPFE